MPDAKKEEPQGYYVGEIPTQTEQVVVGLDGKPMTVHQALVEILKKQDLIMKFLQNKL
jgi:hypothetical protein